MGVIAEAKIFMRDIRDHLIAESATINVLKEVIVRQTKEIEDLHNRLMARNLPELKTYTLQHEPEILRPYSVLTDDAQIGVIGDFGNKS